MSLSCCDWYLELSFNFYWKTILQSIIYKYIHFHNQVYSGPNGYLLGNINLFRQLFDCVVVFFFFFFFFFFFVVVFYVLCFVFFHLVFVLGL